MERAWNTISRIYRFIRILSLDILAGVICGYTFARIILGSDCPPLTPVILCATVWLIYTLDHLLDAMARKGRSARPAYRWHYQNRKILWPVLLAVGLTTAGLSLAFLPARILIFGCVLGGGLVIYTLVQHGMPGKGRTLPVQGGLDQYHLYGGYMGRAPHYLSGSSRDPCNTGHLHLRFACH